MRQILAAAALMLAGTPAYAQVPCLPTGEALTMMKEKYGLEPVYGGVAIIPSGTGLLLENADSGKWAFVVVRGDLTCILAEGSEGQRAGGKGV